MIIDQFLFNEFELLNDEVADNSVRSKRDAEVMPGEKKECSGRHGEWKNNFLCCAGDTFDPEHVKQMKEVKKQCAMKLRANNCKYNTLMERKNNRLIKVRIANEFVLFFYNKDKNIHLKSMLFNYYELFNIFNILNF